MPYGPFNQVYCDGNQRNRNDLSYNAIGTIETSDEWSEWRNSLAEQMYNEYIQCRR